MIRLKTICTATLKCASPVRGSGKQQHLVHKAIWLWSIWYKQQWKGWIKHTNINKQVVTVKTSTLLSPTDKSLKNYLGTALKSTKIKLQSVKGGDWLFSGICVGLCSCLKVTIRYQKGLMGSCKTYSWICRRMQAVGCIRKNKHRKMERRGDKRPVKCKQTAGQFTCLTKPCVKQLQSIWTY